ncbi:MAG: FkbM family methyltransferase, partial [Acidimicrobiales bacterium]
VLLSRLVGASGRVLAVEPAADNLALLRANLGRAAARNVEVVEAAAWDHAGTLSLVRSVANSGDHRATPAGAGARVRAVRLDDLLAEPAPVHVVKTDVQGGDHRAIAGLSGAIERCRPILVVEFWPEGIRWLGDDPVEAAAGYPARGYRVEILGSGDAPEAPQDLVARADADPSGFLTLVCRP